MVVGTETGALTLISLPRHRWPQQIPLFAGRDTFFEIVEPPADLSFRAKRGIRSLQRRHEPHLKVRTRVWSNHIPYNPRE